MTDVITTRENRGGKWMAIKQYVNLPIKVPDHHGRQVVLEVKAKSLGGKKVAESEWWVEPAGGSNTDSKYLSAAARARVRRKYVPNDKSRFRNVLILPHVGGDTYKVKCSKRGDRSSAVEVEEIQTYRKIFYTVHWMTAACRDTFDRVKGRIEAAFDAAKIELKLDKKVKTTRAEDQTQVPASAPYDFPQLYPRQRTLPNKPFHLRVLVLNDVFDLSNGTYDTTLNGTKTWTCDLNDEMADTRPNEWLVRARARVAPTGRWRDIKKYTRDIDLTSFEVDLGAHPVLAPAIDAGKSVEIEVSTREHGHFCGYSHGNFCVVRINEPTNAEVTILQTFTHEVGHGFGQTVAREANYDGAGAFSKWEPNPKHYTGHGGQGPHCSTNATKKRQGGKRVCVCNACTAGGAGPSLCTMFHSADDHVDADGKFCPECLPRLTRRNLGATELRAKGWDWY